MSDAAASSTAPLKPTNGANHEGSSNGVSNKDIVIGFRPQPMAVIPPREQDLQQSYASIVGNDDSKKEGWYGSFSKELSHLTSSPSFPG